MPESVLIIDDEPGITAALMTRLEAAGYKVYHAINGLAGVEATALHRPDVIILDIRMPDIDGYEVCARLRKTPEPIDTPIIFLSAHSHDSARQHAMDVGGSAFLSKPYEAADVLAAIEHATRSAHQFEGGGDQACLKSHPES